MLLFVTHQVRHQGANVLWLEKVYPQIWKSRVASNIKYKDHVQCLHFRQPSPNCCIRCCLSGIELWVQAGTSGGSGEEYRIQTAQGNQGCVAPGFTCNQGLSREGTCDCSPLISGSSPLSRHVFPDLFSWVRSKIRSKARGSQMLLPIRMTCRAFDSPKTQATLRSITYNMWRQDPDSYILFIYF